MPHSTKPVATTIGALLQADIPILIPCFNAVTYVRKMVAQLVGRGFRNVILVDNSSQYPPMVEYLKNPDPHVAVVLHTENHGPRSILTDPVSFALLPQIFCVTDPDLVFSDEMPADFVAQLAALTEKLQIGKAGLAIDISERHRMRQETFRIGNEDYTIWDWEQKFWSNQVSSIADGNDPVYAAPTDTTFAVYNKSFFDPEDFSRAVRVGGRYTCRHLPWYPDTGLPLEEERFYSKEAKDSFYLRERPSEKVRYETMAIEEKVPEAVPKRHGLTWRLRKGR